jgi:hypothetical protein
MNLPMCHERTEKLSLRESNTELPNGPAYGAQARLMPHK